MKDVDFSYLQDLDLALRRRYVAEGETELVFSLDGIMGDYERDAMYEEIVRVSE